MKYTTERKTFADGSPGVLQVRSDDHVVLLQVSGSDHSRIVQLMLSGHRKAEELDILDSAVSELRRVLANERENPKSP